MIAASAAASLRRFNRRQQRRPQAHHANRAATMKLLRELGCVSYWPMNGDDGDRLSGNNLTRVNAPTNVPAPLGGSAIKTNGTTSYGTVAHSATLAFTNLTISAWIVPHALSGGRPLIFKGDTYPTNTDWYIWLEDTLGAGEFSTKIGGTVTGLAFSLSGFSVGKLAHLVATYDGANRRVYLDGVQIASDAKSGNLNNSSGTLRFGQYATYYLSATVYDLALWGRGIDGQEVKRLYDHYRTRGGPQVDGRRRNIVSRYDPTPYLRTGTDRTVTQVNDHGASAPGPFTWSGSTLGYSMGNYVTGSANNGADTYALKFDNNEFLPSSATITGIEIKVTAYSPAATLDLQTLAYGPYAAVYKNGTYQSSTGAGQYLTSTPTEYTIGGSSNTLGVTWSSGDTIDIALWVNLYDNAGTTPNCYITACTMQIWYSIGGSTQTITVTVASATASASAPTVTPGAATVSASVVSASATAIVPTVTPGVATITISVCSATAAAITPAVTAATTVVCTTASASAAAIVPTVTPGSTSITIGTCSATAAASAPTLTPTVSIASATASASASAITPDVVAGISTIVVTTAQATAAASAPSLTASVSIVPPSALATAAASPPSVTAGATTITITTASATASAIDAGITNATLITPGEAVATAAAIVPTVTPGSASIVPPAATATAAAVDVTVQAGTSTITVGVASAVAGVASLDIVVAGEAAGSLLFTAYVTASVRSLASLQPSLDAESHLRPSVEGKVF